jgi:hypothetical protein
MINNARGAEAVSDIFPDNFVSLENLDDEQNDSGRASKKPGAEMVSS